MAVVGANPTRQSQRGRVKTPKVLEQDKRRLLGSRLKAIRVGYSFRGAEKHGPRMEMQRDRGDESGSCNGSCRSTELYYSTINTHLKYRVAAAKDITLTTKATKRPVKPITASSQLAAAISILYSIVQPVYGFISETSAYTIRVQLNTHYTGSIDYGPVYEPY
jgi:hypothetical protein